LLIYEGLDSLTNQFTFSGATAMKKILILMVLLISVIGISNAQVSGATDLDQGLQVNGNLASDSTIVGTKYSHILILNSCDVTNEKEFINFQAGARLLILARQTHDSVNAVVYLQVGNNIISGTEGTDFGTILIDTLQSANAWKTTEVININLASYLAFKQCRLKVVALTGVAVGAMLPKWSALIGGQGKLGKLTDRYKAAATIY
jgi:hypothetical protein